jgi:predicted transcriptional regulator
MTFRVRSGKKGVALRLHDLEAEIMDVVWSRGLDGFAVNDVLAVLEKRRDIAYTTIMTTLARLHDKGVLERRRDGKRYLYSPRGSREEFLRDTAREVLEGLGSAKGREAFALLADAVSSADSAVLDELEERIRRRRRELGS